MPVVDKGQVVYVVDDQVNLIDDGIIVSIDVPADIMQHIRQHIKCHRIQRKLSGGPTSFNNFVDRLFAKIAVIIISNADQSIISRLR